MAKRVRSVAHTEVPHFIKEGDPVRRPFAAHRRLAKALAAVIDGDPKLRVIGLLGDWGAGKSTVLHVTQRRLQAVGRDPNLPTTYFFTYDAWAHQDDPPRMAFLESLTQFLTDNGLTKLAAWEDPLALLARKLELSSTHLSPVVTRSGKALLAALALIPLANALLSKEGLADLIKRSWTLSAASFITGTIITLLPFAIAAGLLLSWRPERRPWMLDFWRPGNWTHRRHGKETESVFALLVNKQPAIVNSRVTRSPEPTMLEFQDAFRAIMNAVAGPKRRFVFVIDNLDRLAPSEAFQLWATIRGFFFGADQTASVRSASAAPVVILPVDEVAIRRMYAKENASNLAQSYMDKTFDLVFRVNKPVLTRWTTLLEKQMAAVFGPCHSWAKFAARLYDHPEAPSSREAITPRRINIFVNTLATYWMQWKHTDIPFELVVYFCVFREHIEQDIVAAASQPLAGIERVHENWPNFLAALHFGVALREAEQVLLREPISKALTGEDTTALASLSLVKGFAVVLSRAVGDALDAGQGDASLLFRTARQLRRIQGMTASSEEASAVRRAVVALDTWNAFAPADAEAILWLTDVDQAGTRWLTNLGERIAAAGKVAPPGYAAACAHLWQSLLLRTASAAALPARLWIPGPASVFVAAMGAHEVNDDFLRRITTTASAEDLQSALWSALTADYEADDDRLVHALSVIDVDIDWEALADLVVRFISARDLESSHMMTALAGLGTLAQSRPDARLTLQSSSTMSALASLLSDGLNNGGPELVARTLALQFVSGLPFDLMSSASFAQMLASSPEMGEQLDRDLRRFAFDDAWELTQLVSRLTASRSLVPVIRLILHTRLEADDLGPFSADTMLAHVSDYLDLIDANLQEAFVQCLLTKPDIADALGTMPMGEEQMTFLALLIHASGEAGVSARAVLRQRLVALDAATAQDTVDNDDVILDLAGGLAIAEGHKVELIGLYDPLARAVPDLLASTGPSRSRWFRCARFLPAAGMTTLFHLLRDHLYGASEVSGRQELLDAGGQDLLVAGGFAERPDDSIRHILLPSLTSPLGLAYLLKEAALMATWVEAASSDTRTFLAERMRAQREVDEDSAATLNSLLMEWHHNS